MKKVFVVYDLAVEDFANKYIDYLVADTPTEQLNNHTATHIAYTKSQDIANESNVEVIISGKLALKCSEQGKTLESVEGICRAMLQAQMERSDTLLAIGGGVCSDICGFAASIYKRGMHFEVVPTTLLSMADAASGGKNGVNLDGVKNSIGCFKLPDAVHFEPKALISLPAKEVLSGAAEILKTFLLFDAPLYEKTLDLLCQFHRLTKQESTYITNEQKPDTKAVLCDKENLQVHSQTSSNNQEFSTEIASNDNAIIQTKAKVLSELSELARKSAEYKMKVVEQDPFDLGLRHLLNYGHTFGHAIEWAQNELSATHFTHGEAVAIGMVQAQRISEQKGWSAQKGLARKLKEDFQKVGLPTELPYPIELLKKAMRNDKKGHEGMLDFVYISSIGVAERIKISLDDLC